MVLTTSFVDGSGRTSTFVGTRDELGRAFARALPTTTSLQEGFDLKVQLFPAPD